MSDLLPTTSLASPNHEGEASAIDTPRKRTKQTFLVHEADGSTRVIRPVGRDAWMLGKLIAVGARGCTTLEQPAPRTSHYIWKLRHTFGLNISSEEEAHDGPFAGHHARYRLEQRVEFLDPEERTPL
jgi:hypothetical protein